MTQMTQTVLSSMWYSAVKIVKGNTAWLLGDVNMHGVDWKTEVVQDTCKLTALYGNFI